MDIGSIFLMIVLGAVFGAIARFLVPGRDPMGIVATIVLGIVGSFVGGFLASLIFHQNLDLKLSDSWIGAIIGSVIALLIYRQVNGRKDATL